MKLKEDLKTLKRNKHMKYTSKTKCKHRKLRGGGLSAIHKWLRNHYGKANRCEMKDCQSKTSLYEWALKKGKEYKHKRDNYLMLCKSCHRKYDMTDKIKNKISATKFRKNTLTYLGKSMSITEWARELGISRYTLSSRLFRGWSVKKALSTKPRKKCTHQKN